MNVFIAGQHGQLSQALQALLAEQAQVTVVGRAQVDFTRLDELRQRVLAARPDVIINAAAYTAVDAAESDAETATLINERVPRVFAEAAQQLGVPLVHYSTDYVFDGTQEGRYREDAPTCPLNVYGRTKLAGENAVRDVAERHLILRTSWVYSWQGNNFLRTMVRLLSERDELNIVADQVGAPTWTRTIADATQRLLARSEQDELWGTYHLTSTGETSWFGFAEQIGQRLREEGLLKARLNPIPSSAYPTPAYRPKNSRLSTDKLAGVLGQPLPDWQSAFAECWAERTGQVGG
ncbi:dTDP-4-dehydrorhamnose reductase [uncultured Pseudomonas sp.]|uniref:dTDP-4-dehydrorhamnose reductase n=1 Tax=uncultured Pseudomonas sp. TaxID=114707 RepID=UPI0025F16257|nr:dTDP-4-dehydrorhamnose reductase [uncultured Pseudomonas sp.]